MRDLSSASYTSVHSTLSSMQNVTVRFQKYPSTQGHLSTVPFSCCATTTQREKSFNIGLRGRRRHEIQCQLRQSLVAGLAIQPKLYGTLCLKWSSVLELCCVSLQIRTQTLPLRARISLTNWYVRIKITNATQFLVR